MDSQDDVKLRTLLEVFISCQYYDIWNPELTSTESDALLRLFNQNHDLTRPNLIAYKAP